MSFFCIYPDYHWGNIAKKMLSTVALGGVQ